MDQRPRRPPSRRIAALALALTLGGLTACGHRSAAPAPTGSSSPSAMASAPAAAGAPPMRVTYRSVSGRLPAAARRHLARQFEGIVDRWWEAAYLTDRRAKSFPAFTPAAARLAQRQAVLMTSSLPAGTTIAVVRRRMGIDVLAVHRRAVGADVVADLVYRAGAAAYHVHGTLSLTPTSHGWRVFAFDVQRSRVEPRNGASRSRSASPSPTPGKGSS